MTLAALAVLALFAAAETATIELKPPAGPVIIGTPVELEGKAQYAERLSLSFRPPEPSTGAVAVLGAELGPVELDGGAKRQTVKVKVAAFELGMVSVPSLVWELRGETDQVEPARSAPVRFESVGPPGVKPDQEIRDIRGPLAPAWWPLALLLALLAGALVWWWRRREKEGSLAAAAAVDNRLPHERALDELHRLFQSELPVKEFYIRLTDILRRYFEGRYGIDAAVLTTGDLMRHLRSVELDRPLLARCRDIFDHADLVKFAKWVPSTAEIRKDWTEAEQLVQQTAPKPPPVAQAANQ